MSKRKRVFSGLWIAALGISLMLAGPLMSGGCSGCNKQDQPATAAPPKPAAKEPAAKAEKKSPAGKKEKQADTAAKAAPGAVVPAALDVLGLTPDSSMIAVAVPPLSGLQTKAIALAKRLVSAKTDVDAEVAKYVAALSAEAKVPEAKSVADVVKAKGFNPDAAIGLFVDLDKSAASLKSAVESLTAAPEAAKPAEAPPKEGAAPAAPPAKPAPPSIDFGRLMGSMEMPSFVIALPILDAKVAEETVKESLKENNDFDPAKWKEVEAAGVVMHTYETEEITYFVSDTHLVVSNSRPMLEEVIPKLKSPAPVRYGSVECPATEPDEMVALFRMDRLMPRVGELLPVVLAADPKTAAYAGMNMDAINEMLLAYGGDDPLVFSIGWTEKKIDLLWRYDLAKHTAMADLAGDAKPLRLGAMLPDNTLLLMSIRINDKLKKSLETWMNAMPGDMQNDPGFQQVKANLGQVLNLVGDEIALGVTGMDASGGMPVLMLMVGMADAAKGKDYITMLAPLTPGEKYKDVDISALALPSPIPMYLAFAGDILLVANSPDKMKGIIDLAQSKSASPLFASLDPPLDPATPRYGALLLNTKIISDVVLPLSQIVGGMPPNAQGPVTKANDVIREIRVMGDLKDNWIEKRATVSLK